MTATRNEFSNWWQASDAGASEICGAAKRIVGTNHREGGCVVLSSRGGFADVVPGRELADGWSEWHVHAAPETIVLVTQRGAPDARLGQTPLVRGVKFTEHGQEAIDPTTLFAALQRLESDANVMRDPALRNSVDVTRMVVGMHLQKKKNQTRTARLAPAPAHRAPIEVATATAATTEAMPAVATVSRPADATTASSASSPADATQSIAPAAADIAPPTPTPSPAPLDASPRATQATPAPAITQSDPHRVGGTWEELFAAAPPTPTSASRTTAERLAALTVAMSADERALMGLDTLRTLFMASRGQHMEQALSTAEMKLPDGAKRLALVSVFEHPDHAIGTTTVASCPEPESGGFKIAKAKGMHAGELITDRNAHAHAQRAWTTRVAGTSPRTSSRAGRTTAPDIDSDAWTAVAPRAHPPHYSPLDRPDTIPLDLHAALEVTERALATPVEQAAPTPTPTRTNPPNLSTPARRPLGQN